MTTARIPGTNQITDTRTLAMLKELERLNPHIDVRVTQGSYRNGATSASAGTHDGGGVLDLHAVTLTREERTELLIDGRRIGFAIWLRTPAQSDWPYHFHAVAIGCSDLSRSAYQQVLDYHDKQNGLASHGPDDGPAGFYGMTWELYNQMKNAPRPPDVTVSMKSIQMAVNGELVTASRAFDVEQFMAFVGPNGIGVIPDYTVAAWKNARANRQGQYGAVYVRYGVTQLQFFGGVSVDGVFGPVTGALMRKLGGYTIVQ